MGVRKLQGDYTAMYGERGYSSWRVRLERVASGCTGLMAFLGEVHWVACCCEDKLGGCVMCVRGVGIVLIRWGGGDWGRDEVAGGDRLVVFQWCGVVN